MKFPDVMVEHITSIIGIATVMPKADLMNGIDSKAVLSLAELIEGGFRAEELEVKLANGDLLSVQSWCASAEGNELMNAFWGYFNRQWLKKEGMIDIWNRSDDKDELNDRSSNALESYNSQIKKTFKTIHPRIMAFAKGLKDEIRSAVDMYQTVLDGNSGIHDDEKKPIKYNRVPDTYDSWEVPTYRIRLDGTIKEDDFEVPALVESVRKKEKKQSRRGLRSRSKLRRPRKSVG